MGHPDQVEEERGGRTWKRKENKEESTLLWSFDRETMAKENRCWNHTKKNKQENIFQQEQIQITERSQRNTSSCLQTLNNPGIWKDTSRPLRWCNLPWWPRYTKETPIVRNNREVVGAVERWYGEWSIYENIKSG